jgi:hypothetical protein
MVAKKTMACVFALICVGLPSSAVSARTARPSAVAVVSAALPNRHVALTDHPEAPVVGEAENRAAAPRLTRSEAALVAWAADRFAAAGLDTPSVTVAFTPGPENCGGFEGRYYSATETVSVCVDEHASDLVMRTTLLHEMSHAWTHHHLDAANRTAFVELRNTPTWDSWDFAWSDRAIEHAAVVMAWGLMDIHTFVQPVGDTSQRALEESFRLLTGFDPINDGSVPTSEPTALAAGVAARLN